MRIAPLVLLVTAVAAQDPPAPPAAQPKRPDPAAAAPAAATPAAAATYAVTVGTGTHRYGWVPGWGALPGGAELGNTHGCLVVDQTGRILANTDTEQAVVAFAPGGELLTSWGKEFRGGLHGMCLRVEDGAEVLYLAHTGRHEVVKTTIDGTVLWTLGWPEASGIYASEDQYRPTAVAVAPDGRFFVADGYGRSWVHAYAADRTYVKSFAGPGTEPGKTKTPHGLLLDTRGKEPLLLVCDRENHRLQWFTLDGTFVRLMDQGLKRPCNAWPLRDGGLAVADLVGRVTILDGNDRVVCHLGDTADEAHKAKNGVGRALWKDGTFFAPHSVCEDRDGNLYVMDWNAAGRITKLARL